MHVQLSSYVSIKRLQRLLKILLSVESFVDGSAYVSMFASLFTSLFAVKHQNAHWGGGGGFWSADLLILTKKMQDNFLQLLTKSQESRYRHYKHSWLMSLWLFIVLFLLRSKQVNKAEFCWLSKILFTYMYVLFDSSSYCHSGLSIEGARWRKYAIYSCIMMNIRSERDLCSRKNSLSMHSSLIMIFIIYTPWWTLPPTLAIHFKIFLIS